MTSILFLDKKGGIIILLTEFSIAYADIEFIFYFHMVTTSLFFPKIEIMGTS